MTADDYALQEVPYHFFNPELWSMLKLAVAAQQPSYGAIYRDADALEALRLDPSPFFEVARRELAGRESAAVVALNRVAELRDELLADLKAKLQSGELVATGLLPQNPVPIPIPASLWPDLDVIIPDGNVKGAGYLFQRVRVGRFGSVAQSLAARCRDWMRAQLPSLKKLAKKETLHLAKMEFGTELTVREFNAAYREIFRRSRGRPPKHVSKN